MENASNQDDGKAVGNVVSNHEKSIDNVVSNLLQPEFLRDLPSQIGINGGLSEDGYINSTFCDSGWQENRTRGEWNLCENLIFYSGVGKRLNDGVVRLIDFGNETGRVSDDMIGCGLGDVDFVVGGLVAETFEWDEEEVSDDEDMVQVKVLMDLTDDELAVRKSHPRNDSPDDEQDIRSSQEYMNDLEMDFHERTLLAKSRKFFKKDEEEVSSYDNEVVKLKVLMVRADDESDRVERQNPDHKLPNFNTGRILVLESQTVNEILGLTEAHNDHESSTESGSEPQTP
nr:retrovirus-related Pol polyprotein from transposon TNT 1-94 [Tanacetum cinerariifolium]